MAATGRPARDRAPAYNPPVIPRVFAPGADRAGAAVVLDGDEAAHLTRVRRLGVGAAVRVFDGAGHEWHGTIRDAVKGRVTVGLDRAAEAAPEPRIAYTVALAVLKGDATDEAVRDAVMLGAAAIRPFVAARSEVSLAVLERARRVARWTRVAVASAKQCGRAVVPPIHGPVSFEAVVADSPGTCRLLLVEPAALPAAQAIADVGAPEAATLAIGPEGGWTPDEVALAVAAGWVPVSLGGRVLRATSAPIVALAACQAVWRDR
jgi:16S rRNA (uracil1498-N3)-methyltransferase